MSSNIQPFVITTTNTAVSFSVTCQQLNLFTNAEFRVDSFDVDGNIVNRQFVTLTNEQYLSWNNNDEYIVTLVANQLGYIIVS